MTKERSIVLLSGGLNSAISAAIAAQTDEVFGLHFENGQKMKKLTKTLGINYITLPIPISNSFQIGQMVAIAAAYADAIKADNIYLGCNGNELTMDTRKEFFACVQNYYFNGTIQAPVLKLPLWGKSDDEIEEYIKEYSLSDLLF